MNISWRLWLCIWVLFNPYFGAAADEYIDGDPTSVSSTPSPISSVSSSSSSFLDLPTDILGLVATTLDPKSFCALKSSCRGLRGFLSEERVMQQQLQLWGVLLAYECGALTKESIVILSASPTLLTLWESKNYNDILKKRVEIIKELRRSALMEDDPTQKEIILRQAVMLGGAEASTSWKDTLCLLSPGLALKHVVNTFIQSKEWGARATIDEVVLRFMGGEEESKLALFDTIEGALYLKQLCMAGSFQTIYLLAHKIRMGEGGFIKDEKLSKKLIRFLSQGTLESAWIMIRPKKNPQYRKIILQDVLPEIMSAIDARKYE